MGKTHRKLGRMFTLMLAFTPLVHAQNGQAARGKYLVENVAMCGDCHTPTLPTGQPDRARLPKGAALAFQPIHPIPKWSGSAQDAEAVVAYLKTLR